MKIANPLCIINMLSCLLIMVRIITWKNNGSRFKPLISFIEWLLLTSCMMLIVSLILGYYRLAESSEVVINIILCIAIFYSSGNIAKLFKKR